MWTEGPDKDDDDSDDDGDSDSGDDDGLVWGEVAPSLTSGLCDTVNNCSECRWSWYETDTDSK